MNGNYKKVIFITFIGTSRKFILDSVKN